MQPIKFIESESLSAFSVYQKLKKKKSKKQNFAQVKKMRNTRKRVTVDTTEAEIHEIPGTSSPNVPPKRKKKSKSKGLENGFEVVDIDTETINADKDISSPSSKKKDKSAQLENVRKSNPNKDPSIDSGKKGKKTTKGIEAVPSTSSAAEAGNDQEVVSLSGDDDIEVLNVNSGTVEDNEEDEGSRDSHNDGRKLLAFLLNPITPEAFFDHTWEKRPLHIRRYVKEYYKPVFCSESMDNMLRKERVLFSKHLDVTSYIDGKRETHNPVGRAMPRVVWDFYKNGCSIRLLNPQIFDSKVALLCSTLQEYFGCLVGANAYLTPPKSQGFAPHYDDIEAFILQIEGKKRWRIYPPRSEKEMLPRFSSPNLKQDGLGDPYMDVTLEAGDFLYFPRGFIHQADTMPGEYSLHVTVSTYQHTSWGDLLEKMLPTALKIAMDEDVEFREGLPVGYLNYLGVVHSDEVTPERTKFIDKVKCLMRKLVNFAPIDAAVDQMGKNFMHDALPPVLSTEEKRCSALEDGARMDKGKIINNAEISLHTRIKILRRHILRLVSEEEGEGIRLYYSSDNPLEYHAEEPQFLEISVEYAQAVELLIQTYPKFMCVSDLPLEEDEHKLILAGDLWDKGLLLTYGQLKKV